jgi:hypothetical protein
MRHIYPQANGDIELGDFPAITNPEYSTVAWLATEMCFMNCPYCINKKPQVEPTSILSRLGISGMVDRFVQLRDILEKKTVLIISGGEPAMLNNFPELCEALFKKDFIIELHTNLSHSKISNWLQVAGKYPDQVALVTATYHSWKLDTNKVMQDLYFKNFQDCWDAGLTPVLKRIVLPTQTDTLEEDMNKLICKLPEGAPFLIWPYINGMPKSKTDFAGAYPYSYTQEQKDKIVRLSKYRKKDIEYFMKIPVFAKGSLCGSGNCFIYVDVQGNLHRCHTGTRFTIGSFDTGVMNPCKGPQACPNDVCLNSFHFLWGNTTAASYLGLTNEECLFNGFSNPTTLTY